jgi:hypothetical protein
MRLPDGSRFSLWKFGGGKNYKNLPNLGSHYPDFGGIIHGKEVAVGTAQTQASMQRLRISLRMLAVAVCFPVIVLVIACTTLLHPIASLKTKFHSSVRLWMSVMDWVKGVPIGYTYWVQYEAPSMLDEIAVHHDD